MEEVENEAIRDLVEKQKAAGYHVITDGEFRRSYWHLDFMWGLNGVEHIELDHGYFFHGEETTHGSVAVSGKISGEGHPFVEHFKFVKQFEDENTVARQTIPAPAQLLAELFREENGKNTVKFYPDEEVLIQDIAKAYRTVIKELYEAGCRNIQFDDCTWGMFCDKKYWEARQQDCVTIESEAEKYLRLNNLAIEGRPEDLVITTHVCRGNYHSTWHHQAGMSQWQNICLQMRTWTHIIWSLTMSAREDLSRLDLFQMIKKLFLGLLQQNHRFLRAKS